jgi:hypothetical protein
MPTWTNRWATARRVVGIFFPQRPVLKLDGHGYSPTILHRILHIASVTSAFDVAETALKVVGEISISARQINNLANEVGQELAADRDARTEQYVHAPLPRKPTTVDVPPDLAAVFFDGGRMRTRELGQGRGVHQPHWRETKNAGFHRMKSEVSSEDPQPEMPDCFRNEAYVEKLVKGLKNLKKDGREEELEAESPLPTSTASAEALRQDQVSWQPETLFRTCISSLASSEEFGPMMAAEADARGFFTAKKKAFVGDGQSYNWTIQQRWFPRFVPIADFVHAVEYVYAAAQTAYADTPSRWRQYLKWATACWTGDVAKVIADLRVWQSRIGVLPKGEQVPENDPRKIIHSVITYLGNNCGRMDYPRYRRQGLPVTSSLAESLVKQISRRVKGTEKFWNDGPSGEAILQLRAAVISDGDRLQRWILNRPISPFSPRCRLGLLANSA